MIDRSGTFLFFCSYAIFFRLLVAAWLSTRFFMVVHYCDLRVYDIHAVVPP